MNEEMTAEALWFWGQFAQHSKQIAKVIRYSSRKPTNLEDWEYVLKSVELGYCISPGWMDTLRVRFQQSEQDLDLCGFQGPHSPQHARQERLREIIKEILLIHQKRERLGTLRYTPPLAS